ncbi:MAG: hypothetical protein F6K41_05245 [Symploca sp. SIO3E6]|nr:hypothetical protein [Caldora sp. SIO3E6]
MASQSGDDGIISKILNPASKFIGFAAGVLWKLVGGALSITWTAIWSGIVRSATFLWNFNFNISDEEIHQKIQQSLESLASRSGGFLGRAVGWTVGGFLPGAIVFAFNEPLGLYILKNVGAEALDDLSAELESLLLSAFQTATTAVFYYSFLRVRNALYGDKKRDKKPWSFAQKVEEKIEEIDNSVLQQFIEEFLEESFDASVEAGYVVANSLDSWAAQSRQSRELVLGSQKTVELDFNRGSTDG